MNKPISPAMHGAIDYGFLATMLTAPSLLRLGRRARIVFALFGITQGALNALTDQPLSIKRLVSFRLHGAIEKSSGPVYLLVPVLAGIPRAPRERAFWLIMGAILVTVYNLTDWNATNTNR
ncbi:hypothetical protein AC792_08695 [Arthrobacter sp. RIT-PI-e]|uniref:hypothetical protein n=1 Tax=Arthrobacter sp. RIT-PI-e TaxID=1681197 RepID=UPI00067612F7|nr:hypothetical protein [Arthrobacter sp. RIT-PI-e]KNC19042.1 hypothetical protein AC792_08695 [Arthrobacter sp. RIT-PI-e]